MKKTPIIITIATLALLSVVLVVVWAVKRREVDVNSPEPAAVSVSEETEGLSEAAETVETDEGLAEPVSPDDEGADTEPDENAEPEILKFVDVFGEQYETEINPKVARSPYSTDGFVRDGDSLLYEDDVYYSRPGIDVSHHQGHINWNKVKAAGYDFAFIRLGYRGYGQAGSLNLDKSFDTNIQNAHEAGLDVGVYIFSQAINEDEAREEAEFVIKHLEGYSLELPVVYDPESILDHEARTDDVTGEQFTKNTMLFCKLIAEAGYEPMVYSNMLWEAFQFDMTEVSKYPIWYADYEPRPQTPYDFTFWQYSNTGHVDGVSCEVDLNIQFYKKGTDPASKGGEDEMINTRIDEKIASMSIEEKIYQLFVVTPEVLTGEDLTVSAGDITRSALEKAPVGGLIYFADNFVSPEQTKDMIAKTQEYARDIEGMPLLMCVDEEGGSTARIARNSAFGVEKVGAMANVKSPEEAYGCGDTIGAYLRDLGLNVDFAPVADVLTNSRNNVIGDRSFGSDPKIVTEYSKAYSDGLHDHGILSCYKHFPGHGATEADTHEGYAYTDKTYEELKLSELIPFEHAGADGADMIMVAHISLPNVIGDDTPCSLSKKMMTDILRNEMAYDGIIITDAINMGAIANHYSNGEASAKAFAAGADIILMPTNLQAAYDGIYSAYEKGEITEERIDESLRRIIGAKLQLSK
ncbi:MAG: hypothetical protein J5509_10420 [Lachnospiraceae bacterium]|nr:hypothetical protein [Lachnospiraceae bacterium]